MKRFGLFTIPLLALLTLTACREDHQWHQKLTLVVEAPAGGVTGSSVIVVSARYFRQSIGNEVEYDVTGEAVVVEVAPGKYLFALLGDPSEQFYWAARERFEGLTRRDWLREIPKQTEPVALFPDHLPMLVTFEDVTKPETVKLVDPLDLAASFGPAVSLKAVTLVITSEPVTEGRVEAVLGWLGPYPEPHLVPGDGRTTDIPFAMRVSQGDFIRRAQ